MRRITKIKYTILVAIIPYLLASCLKEYALKMHATQGLHYKYKDGGPHPKSAILQQVTGITTQH